MEPESVQTPSVQGLPSRYGRESLRRLRTELGCLIPLLLVFGLGTWLYAALVVYEPGIFSFGGLLVFGAPFCLLAAALVSEIMRAVRDRAQQAAAHIVPCFDRPLGLGPEDAPAGGYALARHCRFLEELAARRGVAPLTQLGLDDDLDDESPPWRDPQTGMTTVRSLLDEMSGPGTELAEAEKAAIRQELNVLEAALERAEQRGASFRLLLRTSRDTASQPGGLDPSTGSLS
jgi:hypothetical protein